MKALSPLLLLTAAQIVTSVVAGATTLVMIRTALMPTRSGLRLWGGR